MGVGGAVGGEQSGRAVRVKVVRNLKRLISSCIVSYYFSSCVFTSTLLFHYSLRLELMSVSISST